MQIFPKNLFPSICISNFWSILKKGFLKRVQNNGLFFKSNIPQGYGLGSSGAMVAAFYDRYAKKKISPNEKLTKIKLQKLSQKCN